MLKIKFTTISPLHISNGNDIVYNIDYIIKDDRINKLDIDKVSKLYAEKRIFDFTHSYDYKEIAKIIGGKKDILTNDCFAYEVECNEAFMEFAKNPRSEGKKIYREFINCNNRFYIPGSSIKGSLLTIIGEESLGINPNYPKIENKFVIRDSAPLSSKDMMVYRWRRPPEINMLCVKPGVEFIMEIPHPGLLDFSELQKKLAKYSKMQITAAIKNMDDFIEKNPDRGQNATKFSDALSEIQDYEGIINIGFGGGGWFKIKAGQNPPEHKNKNQQLEISHTSYISEEKLPIRHIGWCKIEKLEQ